MRLPYLIVLASLLATPALADRAPTLAETASVEDALEAMGCSGGLIEVEEKNGAVTEYEIEDVDCGDGHLWDFELDAEFKLKKRERQD
ncbi:MAG: hypothetical protein OIF47_03630 [Marinibacterium sp.]|nr:hypothetical protein [Marinibacterium sp.]